MTRRTAPRKGPAPSPQASLFDPAALEPASAAGAGLVFGADEAGRGPILGPMAIAVVGVDREGEAALRALGVADSKSFGSDAIARDRRRALAQQIVACVPACRVRLVEVEQIDHYTRRGLLNVLERRVVLELLQALGAERQSRVVCDGARLFAPLRPLYPRLEAVDHGESAHPAVAAASIVAKDARDRAFEVIAARYAEEFGPLRGGGYLNAATRRFLEAYQARHGTLPPEARRSWGAGKPSDDEQGSPARLPLP
jgi:ribonuclease HII